MQVEQDTIMFVDGRRMIISMIHDIEVPTLGVLSGSGGHTELL